jgi:hypothetical protein
LPNLAACRQPTPKVFGAALPLSYQPAVREKFVIQFEPRCKNCRAAILAATLLLASKVSALPPPNPFSNKIFKRRRLRARYLPPHMKPIRNFLRLVCLFLGRVTDPR